jgi:uncharacterized protein YbaP (TraB family)
MTQSKFYSRNITRFILLFALWQLSDFSALAQSRQDRDPVIEPVTIMVTGRRPGPPLWKVSKDDNVLYIFGYLSPLPKRMRWDDARVKEVLNEAQEFISMPNFGWNTRMPRDMLRNPDGQKLEEVLPPEYWELYLAFAETNFRRARVIETRRPIFAVSLLTSSLYNKHDLASGDKVLKTIDKLAKRNRGLKRSNPNIAWPEGLNARVDISTVTSLENLSIEQELACFKSGLERVMPNINLIKQAANSWAEADVRELIYLHDLRRVESVQGSTSDPCSLSVIDDADLQAEMRAFSEDKVANWLKVVETALANNTTTFTILSMEMLLNEALLLDQLRERGYEVQAPY